MIGLPVALAVSFAPPRIKPLLLMLVILPFWTNLLIRTYAMIAVLRTRGYVNLGLEELWQLASDVAGSLFGQPLPPFSPLPLLYNNTAVVVGIVYVYLPFMVLPRTTTLERLERSYLEASLGLGAGQWRTFVSIVVPLARPGIISGIILVHRHLPDLGPSGRSGQPADRQCHRAPVQGRERLAARLGDVVPPDVPRLRGSGVARHAGAAPSVTGGR